MGKNGDYLDVGACGWVVLAVNHGPSSCCKSAENKELIVHSDSLTLAKAAMY
jgi:hypothetical protein